MSNELSLRTFIENQLQERKLSAREFARLVGVSSSTITRAMSFENPSEPTITFLTKLADATNTELCTLVYLYTGRSWQGLNSRAFALGAMANNLPDDRLDLAERVLRGILGQQDNNNFKEL